MSRRLVASPVAFMYATLVLTVALLLPAGAEEAKKNYKKPIRNPKFDPLAEQVELFDAVDAAKIAVKLIPINSLGGNVLIENKTDKPLTVKVPEAVAGVGINAQFGGGLGGGGLGAGGGLGGGGGGGQQAIGGGLGGGGQAGGGGLGGGGGGFFSVPAEKVILVPFKSVCLEHGKPEPHSGSKYTLVPVSQLSEDPVLYKLLAAIGTGMVDPAAAQAAAWHLANNMSFQELAEKTDEPLGGIAATSYFTYEQLLDARALLARSAEQAAEDESSGKTEQKAERRVRSAKSGRNTR